VYKRKVTLTNASYSFNTFKLLSLPDVVKDFFVLSPTPHSQDKPCNSLSISLFSLSLSLSLSRSLSLSLFLLVSFHSNHRRHLHLF